jgi:hypothetical protein
MIEIHGEFLAGAEVRIEGTVYAPRGEQPIRRLADSIL